MTKKKEPEKAKKTVAEKPVIQLMGAPILQEKPEKE